MLNLKVSLTNFKARKRGIPGGKSINFCQLTLKFARGDAEAGFLPDFNFEGGSLNCVNLRTVLRAVQ